MNEKIICLAYNRLFERLIGTAIADLDRSFFVNSYVGEICLLFTNKHDRIDEFLYEIDKREELMRKGEKLNNKEKYIRRRLGEGATVTEVSRELGVSRGTVHYYRNK